MHEEKHEEKLITDFGKGMEHVKQIKSQNKIIINSRYSYDKNFETKTIQLKDSILTKIKLNA